MQYKLNNVNFYKYNVRMNQKHESSSVKKDAKTHLLC